MELKDIYRFCTKFKKTLLFVSFAFGVLGAVLFYVLPERYYAEGSFYVKRSVELPSSEFFTYEGYYGQQAALSYTDTVVALFESVDMQKGALENLGIIISEKTLRQLDRKYRVKKAGPQLITLILKDSTPEKAYNSWQALSEVTLATASGVNNDGDPTLSITQLSKEPIIRRSYKNLYLNVVVGLGFGLLVGVVSISTKEYLS